MVHQSRLLRQLGFLSIRVVVQEDSLAKERLDGRILEMTNRAPDCSRYPLLGGERDVFGIDRGDIQLLLPFRTYWLRTFMKSRNSQMLKRGHLIRPALKTPCINGSPAG